jgi:hypothetical protein
MRVINAFSDGTPIMGLFTKDIKSMDDLFLHVVQEALSNERNAFRQPRLGYAYPASLRFLAQGLGLLFGEPGAELPLVAAATAGRHFHQMPDIVLC